MAKKNIPVYSLHRLQQTIMANLKYTRDIAAVKQLQYWKTIVNSSYYNITLSIRTVSFIYSN
jgi:hypothetical protein